MIIENRVDPSVSTTMTYSLDIYTGYHNDGSTADVIAKPLQVVREGSKVPGYLTKIKNRQDASSGYSARRTQYKCVYGNATLKYHDLGQTPDKWYKRKQTGFMQSSVGFPTVPVLPIVAAKTRDEALVRFLNDLEGKRRTFQSLVFMGEFRETLALIRSPAKSLRENLREYIDVIVKSLRNESTRIRRRTKRQFYQDMAGTWLEFSFGVLPLINDIKDAIKAFDDVGRKAYVERISGQSKEESLSQNGTSQVNTWNGSVVCIKQLETEAKTSVKVTGAYNFEAENTSRRLNKDIFGLRWSDVPVAMWELLPWSFLYDYFTNLGDILQSILVDTSNLVYCVRNEKREVLARAWYTASHVPSVVMDSVAGSPEMRLIHDSEFTRTIYTPGLPSFHFEMPAPDSVKWINMAALLVARKEIAYRMSLLG